MRNASTMTSVVRGWLLRKPRPARVRVTAGGEIKEFAPQNRSFAKTAETIVALEPDLIELLDARGTLIRAMRGDEDAPDGEEEDGDDPLIHVSSALRSDPNAAMLTHFADLLHRAYKHSTETAFAKMVDLVDRMNDRSTSIEERLERAEARHRKLVDEQVEDAFERAEEVAVAAGTPPGTDLVNQLAGAFLSGQMQRKTEKPPPAANGKGNS